MVTGVNDSPLEGARFHLPVSLSASSSETQENFTLDESFLLTDGIVTSGSEVANGVRFDFVMPGNTFLQETTRCLHLTRHMTGHSVRVI